MDLATLLGLIGAFGLVLLAIILGGAPQAFFNLPAILIVIGGTAAVTMISFSMSEILTAQRVIKHTLSGDRYEPQDAANLVVQLAERARRVGLLALEDVPPTVRQRPFLDKAIGLVVDGTAGEEIESILSEEIRSMTGRHAKGSSVLRRAAEVAPAMGLIGTLIGLVQMLGNLQDPKSIGPAMAIALLTTFYGAILANMVFSPLASKLERKSDEEALVNTVYTMGAASIMRKENPRRLEIMLNALLPPAQRIQYFD